MVVRNVGGRVTPEVINDLAFVSQIAEAVLPGGPLFEVAVIHHTQCGAGALADDAFRHQRRRTHPLRTRDLSAHQRLRARYDVTTGLARTVIPAGPS
jgi:carbonic anhydrase